MKYRIVIEAEMDIGKWIKFLGRNDLFDKLYKYEHEVVEEVVDETV